MKRPALTAISMLTTLGCLTVPAISADLDGPYYRQSDVIIQRPAPPVVVRERIIERYYEPAPQTYYAPRAYAPEPYYYAPRVYAPAPYVHSRTHDNGCGWHHRRAFFGDSPIWWAPRRDCGYLRPLW